jgi:uncharacterized membrane protein
MRRVANKPEAQFLGQRMHSQEVRPLNKGLEASMKRELTLPWGLPPTWLRFLIIVLLVLGVFFRFVNLDQKLYWNDEVYTSLRVSGYTEAEVIQQVLNGNEISVADLQKYQRPNPEKNVIDAIKGLAAEDSQHSPLYYAIVGSWAQFWGQWLDNSVAVTRGLSAFFTLFAFPCIYWLCLELFESSLTGWIAIALLAVSPFHVLYAQVAREYSLWSLTILLSCASLLRAMRLKTKFSWGIYAVTLALAIYSYLFSVFVAIGHAVYVLAVEGFRFNKKITPYLLASLAGILAFTPWLLVIIKSLSNIQNTNRWTSYSLQHGLPELVFTWVRSVGRVFLDFELNYGFAFENLLPYLIPILLIITLVGYSIYFLCCQTSKRVWLFVVILIAAPALSLILPDLILGGRRSSITRYLTPCYLGIQLAVAYLLATKITSTSVNIWRQKMWKLVTIVLVSGGVLSCANSFQAQVWWNNGSSKVGTYPQVAAIINKSGNPLVISDAALGSVMSLSYLLDSKVRLIIQSKCYLCRTTFPWEGNPNTLKISQSFRDVFLFEPSKKLQSRLEKEYKLKPAYEGSKLWRLEK